MREIMAEPEHLINTVGLFCAKTTSESEAGAKSQEVKRNVASEIPFRDGFVINLT